MSVNVREQMYYIDPYLIVAYSKRLKCPVMYCRKDSVTDKRISRALWSSGMEATGEKDVHKGNIYYKLRRKSDVDKKV